MKRAPFAALALGGATMTFATIAMLPGSADEFSLRKPRKVDFDRDVRPILSENCFKCHGPDEKTRAAGLRLDTQEGAWAKALKPGKVAQSSLFHRISTKADALRMPPTSSGKVLKPEQIAILRDWIALGGKYEKHWAFVSPKRPMVPGTARSTRLASLGRSVGMEQVGPTTGAKTPWNWCRNPIDNFVMERLIEKGLKASPEADRRTLIRRATLDLTGLPPTPAEVDAFLADRSSSAYEKVVDRLLASPTFGERMAVPWLDLARYADTHGYHIDSGRQMYRWRDWVIDAYNRNLPYDQFVIEQLAGDLLPNATLSQKIATGFNRNHPINYEGGAIPEEYHAAYIFDRIDTTATTFMGLTLRCGQCHDHKYDPFTQRDYYRLYAFFHNVPENGLDGQEGNAKPFLKAPTTEQETEAAMLAGKVTEINTAIKARKAEAAPLIAKWEATASNTLSAFPALTNGLVAHFSLDESTGTKVNDSTGKQPVVVVRGAANWSPGKFAGALKLDGTNYIDAGNACGFDSKDRFSYGGWVNPVSTDAMVVISRMDNANGIRGWDLYLGGGRVYVHLIDKWEENAIRVNTKSTFPANQWTQIFVTYDGSSKASGVKIYVNSKPTELDVTHDKLNGTIKTDKPLRIGNRDGAAPFKGLLDEIRVYDRDLSAHEVSRLVGLEAVRHILITADDKRTPQQKEELARYYLETHDEPYQKLAGQLSDWTKKRDDLEKAIPTTMVMEEMPAARDTHILVRGQYDKKGDKVAAGVISSLLEMPAGLPSNRLGMAKWLVDRNHPLTARVAVNRYWQHIFGTGLVKTVEDFGTQGERPSHPELLDWLAVQFMEGNGGGSRTALVSNPSASLQASTPKTQNGAWDIKALIRLMVTSATYRQSSVVSPSTLTRDPENRLFSRAPRFRLSAEFVRDQALWLAGLLVPKIGGPSVKPYHPKGLWEDLAFGGGFTEQTYVQGHGDDLYRRSMYTFWKRTCPPPSLQTFDAPEREFCMVRRSVTNTPLQALVLMNDPTYIEASRKFAERVMKEAGATASTVSTPSDRRTGTVDEQAIARRIHFASQWAMSRPARPNEVKLLRSLFISNLAKYRGDPKAAEKFLSVGESPRDTKLDVSELAAWATVAGTIMNLDETITKN